MTESAVFLVLARDVLRMEIAPHGDVEMTESAPVLKTAPRPRVTGTAAPRSVRVKRGRGTVMRIVIVWDILCAELVAVRLREAVETAALDSKVR